MAPAQTNSVIEMAKRNNAVVIWLIAPGVHTPTGFNLDKTSRITGFKIRSADIEALPRITIIKNERPHEGLQLSDEALLSSFGCGPHNIDDSGARTIGPIFYADVSRDADAVVLGVLDALHKPGLVCKKMEGYTSIYCAAPYVPNVFLRAIGKKLNAHIYINTDDLIHLCDNLIMIHANQSGVKNISWHQKAQVVVEIYSGRKVAENCRHWQIKMKQYETKFFFAGTRAVWQDTASKMKKFGIDML
jgi:hypothetical protein